MSYEVRFNESSQELSISGALRPHSAADLSTVLAHIESASVGLTGTISLNIKRLHQMNHVAWVALVNYLARMARERPELRFRVIHSSVVPWAGPRFAHLPEQVPSAEVIEYDRELYPGQDVIEANGGFPEVLRNQTELLWHHEQELLARHGLTPGMDVADICCGLGDFAMLVWKRFGPRRLVAVDHSRPFLAYARNVAGEFGLGDIEYVYGDAANLLLDDASFDFVMCRLSLQVFPQPRQILAELRRIGRPGARVYLTNEVVSHIDGWPHRARISAAYRKAADECGKLGMDLDYAVRMRADLLDMGFEDVRVEGFEINSTHADPAAFASVVRAWVRILVDDVAVRNGMAAAELDELRAGLEAHEAAILDRRGFASWPVWVASARRPLERRV